MTHFKQKIYVYLIVPFNTLKMYHKFALQMKIMLYTFITHSNSQVLILKTKFSAT